MYASTPPCTGWRRLIGCLKAQVIFRTRAINHRAFLRKMTYEDKASYDSTSPCSNELTFEIFSSSLKAEGKNSLDKVRCLKSHLPAKCNVISYEATFDRGMFYCDNLLFKMMYCIYI